MIRFHFSKQVLFCFFAAIISGVGLFSPAWASTPKEIYLYADSCYQKMKNNPDLKKYRHNWINCIERFERVYTAKPHNPWAAAGMYRAAQLHLELYAISNVKRDKSEAADLLNRIVNRYPESLYNARARKLLAAIGSDTSAYKTSSKKIKSKNASSSTNDDGGSSEKASSQIKTKRALKYLTKNAGARQSAKTKPNTPPKPTIDPIEILETRKADGSIPVKFSTLYREKFAKKKAQNGKIGVGTRSSIAAIISAAKAEEKDTADGGVHGNGGSNGKKPASLSQSEDLATPSNRDQAMPYPAESSKNGYSVNALGDAFVTGLRYWSTPNYTRVVVDAGAKRAYTHHMLDKNPSLKKPQRLYVDIEKSVLGKEVPAHTIINDDLLTKARAGQHTPHSVRVVVDIKSFDNYKIFSLNDPFRIVIDVWGHNANVGSNGKAGGTIAASSKSPIPPDQLSKIGSNTDQIHASAIAKQLALGVKTIVIDPGHGGRDPGALGYYKGVYEKDVVLSIAQKLAKKMRHRLKCNVILTRSNDVYLSLEERTAIANTKNADLFISLHCNAARNKKLTGIETYYLNLATDESAINVAARENATSRKNISDLQSILNDLMKNAKINESSRLSGMVQTHLYKGMAKKYSKIRNLGVKQAPFYVLLGATMPSILIETSFISNKTECKRLTTASYQNALCNSIIDGVQKYIKETDPRAL